MGWEPPWTLTRALKTPPSTARTSQPRPAHVAVPPPRPTRAHLALPELGPRPLPRLRPRGRAIHRSVTGRPTGAILARGPLGLHAGASIDGQVRVRAGERNLSMKLVLGTSSNQRSIV